jgi:SAM-dependent methyltransferase
MKNRDKWKKSFYKFDSHGKLMGTHMHRIIGYAYAPVIREHSKGLLADIGCGDVPYYEIYKDLVKDNICVDWRTKDDGDFHLDHIADLNNGIPLESNSFDTVLCTDVIEHIKTPSLLFSELARITNDGGKIIVTTPFLYWIHNAPYDYHRYTKYMFKEFCKDNNLQLLSIEEYGGLPEIIYDLVYKGYIFYNFPMRRWFLAFWWRFGKFLYKRAVVQRLSRSSRETFPLGYILVAQKHIE